MIVIPEPFKLCDTYFLWKMIIELFEGNDASDSMKNNWIRRFVEVAF